MQRASFIMIKHFTKTQGTKAYRVPVIFMDNPDKETVKRVEEILENTPYEGDYWDRVNFSVNLGKAGITGAVPMCAEQI